MMGPFISGQKGRNPRKGIGTRRRWCACTRRRELGQKGQNPRKGIGTALASATASSVIGGVRKAGILERGLEPLGVAALVPPRLAGQKTENPRKGIGTTPSPPAAAPPPLVRKRANPRKGIGMSPAAAVCARRRSPSQNRKNPRKGIGTSRSAWPGRASLQHCQKGRNPRKGIGTPGWVGASLRGS